MPDLNDGESIEMQGSGSKPYVLKNIGGVYSCTCPAWRNQSIGIERRTCKHLRKLRGDAAEEARIGSALPAKPKQAGDGATAPPLLLAESWDFLTDPTGWWLSEKLDGVRAYWDGKQFRSRLGNLFHAPDWFIAGLPNVPLDGELWLGRKKFQRTVSIVRRQDKSELWKEISYVVFDAPQLDKGFEARLKFVGECLKQNRPRYARPHEHIQCKSVDHLKQELARLEALGGEGLMLRRAGSRYESGRSSTLLKVKSFHDAEARVVKHQEGAGRHKGRLGALACRVARWHDVLGRHRLLRCRAREPTAGRQHHHVPLPGAVRRRRAALSVVHRHATGWAGNDMFHFWSMHVSGANFALADGSAHYVGYTAVGIMPALASRAGGETVSLPD